MKKSAVLSFSPLVAAMLLAVSGAQAQTYSFASGLGPEAAGATGNGAVLVDFDVGAQTLSLDSIWFGL